MIYDIYRQREGLLNVIYRIFETSNSEIQAYQNGHTSHELLGCFPFFFFLNKNQITAAWYMAAVIRQSSMSSGPLG